MSGSNWCVILAIVGCLTSPGPAPGKSGHTEQTKAAPNAERSLDTIANAQTEIAKQADPGEYQEPCPDGEYNNKSDLCAQWYAARAARDAADWAYWALLVGAVGAVGIVVALLLTVQSNQIARHMAGRQLRAYLGFRNIEIERVVTTMKEGYWMPQIHFTNGGSTPAYNVMGGAAWGDFADGVPDQFKFADTRNDRGISTIAPAIDITFPTEKIPYGKILEVTQGKTRLFAWGWVEYSDIFPSSPRRRTECALEIRLERGESGLSFEFVPLNVHNGMDFNCLKRATEWPVEKRNLLSRLRRKRTT